MRGRGNPLIDQHPIEEEVQSNFDPCHFML